MKTLAHEVGHVLLHNPTDATGAHCRGVKEVEAESVAYLVAAAHGLDTCAYTFAYVAGWAAGGAGSEPEQVVRDLALAAAGTVLDPTAVEAAPTVDAGLAARVQAGAERTATALTHADTPPP